jgi:diguanylate cyclase (GGDEF)-like protein
LPSWERATTNFLSILHLQSLKSKIIVFALLATLIPSLTMGWLSYVQNRRFLNEKITQELQNVTSQASREFDLWLKERLYELRVFSSSYVVSENLEKILRADLSHIENRTALRRVRDYLKSVRSKFIDYEELMAVDVQGNLVASTYDKETSLILPHGWLKLARAGKSTIGNPFWDQTLKAGVMVITQPIVSPHERFLGVLAAKLNFRSIGAMLKNYAVEQVGELYVITQEGTVLISSQPLSSGFMKTKLLRSTTYKLFSHEGHTLDYRNYKRKTVVGAVKRVTQLDWGVVAEEERAAAYAQIFRLRNLTIGLVAGLLFVIGLAAYLLGLTIVRPLDRLIKGADKVAAGDLDVDLPVPSHGELGYMTEVFNHMVLSLRRGREELASINETLRQRNIELHELSITDNLTTLHNRNHLMDTLATEVARSKRRRHLFAVLMIDIDHFKRYNDTFGHLAGDDVLRKMAAIYRDSIRSCDYAARYGGEEFLIMLPETNADEAVQAAERIRARVAEERFDSGDKAVEMTVSIGVAVFTEHGDNPESLIKSADGALYKAKKGGRNKVVLAGEKTNKRTRQSAAT